MGRKAPSKWPREALEQQLDALQRDFRQLQLEHDLLKNINELLKMRLGVDLHLQSNREKTQLLLQRMVPEPHGTGRPRKWAMRETVNDFYALREGIA